MKEFIKKIRNLPLKQRKIILWVFVVILGITLGIFWFKIAKERVKGFRNEEFNLPGFDRRSLEVPEFGSEEPEKIDESVKKIEELMKEIKQQDSKATSD